MIINYMKTFMSLKLERITQYIIHNDIDYLLIIYITSTLIYSSVYLDNTTENLNLKYVSMFIHCFKQQYVLVKRVRVQFSL